MQNRIFGILLIMLLLNLSCGQRGSQNIIIPTETEYLPPTVSPIIPSPTQTEYIPPAITATEEYIPPAAPPTQGVETTSVVYDLVSLANLAHWQSGAGELSWAYSDTDERGFVMNRTNVMMEDGNVYSLILETHPQWVDGGFIGGAFTDIYQSGYIVQPQDTFVGLVGFMENATAGDATFKVMIRPENGPNEWIGEITDTYDGQLKKMVIPLLPWAGQRADIIVRVDAGTTSAQDWAAWVVAQIVRN